MPTTVPGQPVADELPAADAGGAPFDPLARLTALVLEVPVAFVVSVETAGSWHTSSVGLDRADDGLGTVEESFCRHVVDSGEPVVLDDARADPRTRHSPFMVSLGMAAWAGFPILGPNGEVLGTLGVADSVARHWSDREVLVLEALAASASTQMAWRSELTAERRAHAEAEARVVEAAHLAGLVAELGQRSAALARTLQQSLLPPMLPEIPGLEVAARYQPAKGEEVVGDFYDVFRAARSSWCVVMGDVCGKGPDAAAVTALAHYTLREAASRTVSPARVLGRLNEALLQQRPGDERFLTVALAMVRVVKGRVLATIASAGHPLPQLRRSDGTVEDACKPGMALGLFDDPPLVDTLATLGPGDSLVFYTDGVTEARRGTEELGSEGLRHLLAGASQGSAAHLANFIEAHVGAYRDGLPRDDTAILVVRVPEPAPGPAAVTQADHRS